ncbi:hypothetical protein EPI10_001989 [Gossypium australe]|uniref:Uncharacterized protein n=1 Tax=Gossypium australe TaxID=47621 RepID=A0A5B6VD17_9ROSI|nr:hypothetical protein EPI10_001989 [Gossypium australe]
MRLARQEGLLEGTMILNVQSSTNLEKYLGLPNMVGRAILEAIPMYSMACFLLPKSLCMGMECIMGNFLVAKRSWQEWDSLLDRDSNPSDGGCVGTGSCGLQNTEWHRGNTLYRVGTRDSNGRVLGSETVIMDNIPTTFTTEALACV